MSLTRPNLHPLARMTVTSSGSSTITLGVAVSGFLTFDLAGCSTQANGQVVAYAISDTTQRELGYGVYRSSSLSLTRGSSTQGLFSTNGNSPINMSNGAQVFITPTAGVLNDITGKNRIINPGMVIDQRNAGGSVSVAASTTYDFVTVDRWAVNCTGATATVQRSTASPPTGFSHYLAFNGAAGITALSIEQPIEALNVSDMTSQYVTHSCWMRADSVTAATWEVFVSSATNNFNDDTGGTPVSSGSFTISTGWTMVNATFSAGSSAHLGMMLRYSVGASSGTWGVTGVQFERNYAPTDYERRLLSDEINLCERYYEKSKALETPSSALSVNGFVTLPTGGMSIQSSGYVGGVQFRTEKFSTPTVVVSPYGSSNQSRVSDDALNTEGAGSGTPANVNSKGFRVQNGSGATLSLTGAESGFVCHYTAEAELF